MVDYYSVLGVPRDASSDDIKAAFRRMALKFHPDRHAGASQAQQRIASDQFKQVKEAYEVLGNERQRASYNSGASRYRTSSYGPSSTSSSYTGYSKTSSSSYDWYRSTAYNNAYGNTSSSSSTDWSSRSAYGSGGSYAGGRRRTNAPEYHVRWGPWTVNPAEGPKIMFRVTVFGYVVCDWLPESVSFGLLSLSYASLVLTCKCWIDRAFICSIAVCTLMFMDSISSAAWHRRNAGKTYEEMLDRLEHEKQLRAREKGSRGDPK